MWGLKLPSHDQPPLPEIYACGENDPLKWVDFKAGSPLCRDASLKFIMDTSCGPSSALSSLSKHTDRDVSYHPHLRGGPVPTAPQFRQVNANSLLNQEFAQFSNSNTFSPQYIKSSPIPVGPNSHAWVQDFGDLSLSDPLRFKQNDLHQQSLQQSRSATQRSHFKQIPTLHVSTNFKPIMNMRTDLSLPVYATEHREMHAMEQQMNLEREAFENEFELVAAQIDEANLASTQEVEKGTLAETARRVEESLKMNSSGELAEKLEQSSFLKLMTQLSSREMELDGDSFVRTGRTNEAESSSVSAGHLPDPLADLRQHMPEDLVNNQYPPLNNRGSYIDQHNHDVVRVNALHLPDPLAHIANGSLDPNLLSLQAARVISNDQVSTSDWMEDAAWLDRSRHDIMHKGWQEVYDDYRHDDDSK